jgi:thymidylate synthase
MKEYSKMLEDTLLFGDWKDNRTGIRCLTSTPKFFEHNMANGFPLLTQKQVSFKNIAVELEAFISGITDKRWLIERGCNIWNEWGNPQTTVDGDQAGNSDLGEYYGWCWRRFGQPYTGIVSEKLPPIDEPCDQLASVIRKLKTNPNDRRLIVSAWNPLGLDRTALPSCHLLFILQHINGKLSLNWTQRSVDSFLGLPYNIASYGLLLELIAYEVGMAPHMLTGNLVDFHIYENHVEQCKELISRAEHPLPTIKFKHDSIWDWTHRDAILRGYEHSGKLSADVAI